MKQYHIFFEAERFLLDKTELEERKGELTVMILSSIRDEYTKEIYRQDVEEAVHLHIPDIWKFIFWKHTKETTLYNKLYSEFESSYKEENIPLSVRYGIDFNVKYFCHYFNVGILGQYDESLIDALDKEDVLKYFSFIEYLDEYQFSNPDPRYFDAILKSAKVKAENTVMIGSRIDIDILPAKQIGMMKTIRFKAGMHKDQEARYPYELADYEFDDMNCLADIIDTILQKSF